MSDEKVKLTLGDWMWNASIAGFVNIVGEENVKFPEDRKDTVEFSVSILQNFEEKYFKYLNKTYEKELSWYKIVDFIRIIEHYENDGYEKLDLKALRGINKYIKDILKYYIKSASYQAAYDLINSNVDILEKEKKLSTIKEPKNDEDFNGKKDVIISEVKDNFETIKEVIDFFNKDEVKKYVVAKNVIYSIIKNSWNGVCFLNPQTKEKDVYLDYKNYFVEPAVQYIKEDKKKFKYNCFTCDMPMKDLNNDVAFLNATGFDVNRKPSHVWNFINDIAICPVCKLIYSCMPAGMIYVYDRGTYINANFSVKYALEKNNLMKTDILSKSQGESINIYMALVNAFYKESNEKTKYELADIQVVRYENETYRFNILSKKTLKIINDSKDDLNYLIKASFKEVKTFFNIYELVIQRIFNNQNLYTLIHKAILYKLSNSQNCYFNMLHIKKLLYINIKILGGMGYMTKVEKDRDIVKEANAAGYYLRDQYKGKEAENKLPGINYRILNALKTNNKDMFMDVVLNCYLYVKKQVPKIVTEVLKDEDEFKTIGYAFAAGLIDGKADNGKSE